MLGDNTQLNCTGSYLQDYTVTWDFRKIGQRFNPPYLTHIFDGVYAVRAWDFPRYYVNINAHRERNLEIANVTYSDAGTYYCYMNGFTTSDTGIASLVVIGMTDIDTAKMYTLY